MHNIHKETADMIRVQMCSIATPPGNGGVSPLVNGDIHNPLPSGLSASGISNLPGLKGSGGAVDPNRQPLTGKPVLVTPQGQISMRNMRKERTPEELVRILPAIRDF